MIRMNSELSGNLMEAGKQLLLERAESFSETEFESFSSPCMKNKIPVGCKYRLILSISMSMGWYSCVDLAYRCQI